MAKIHYTGVAVVGVDGKIAHHRDERSFTWSSGADKAHFSKLMDSTELNIIGRHTYEVAKADLQYRRCLVFTKNVKSVEYISPYLTYINPGNVNIDLYLHNLGIKKALVHGGQKVYDWFLLNQKLNDFYLTMEPLIFGDGVPLFQCMPKADMQCQLMSCEKQNAQGTLIMHYQLNGYAF